jgi:hypothetical protein
VYRKLKLITKTQSIPIFLNTAKATMRCVKRFRNEDLQVRCGWWLLSSLFAIRSLRSLLLPLKTRFLPFSLVSFVEPESFRPYLVSVLSFCLIFDTAIIIVSSLSEF